MIDGETQPIVVNAETIKSALDKAKIHVHLVRDEVDDTGSIRFIIIYEFARIRFDELSSAIYAVKPRCLTVTQVTNGIVRVSERQLPDAPDEEEPPAELDDL